MSSHYIEDSKLRILQKLSNLTFTKLTNAISYNYSQYTSKQKRSGEFKKLFNILNGE